MGKINCMLANKYRSGSLAGSEFSATLKLDGFRCIAVKKGGAVTFYTRSGKPHYGVEWDHKTQTASSPLADKLEEWFDKSGDKAKLKKRISELEAEVKTLERIIKGGKR